MSLQAPGPEEISLWRRKSWDLARQRGIAGPTHAHSLGKVLTAREAMQFFALCPVWPHLSQAHVQLIGALPSFKVASRLVPEAGTTVYHSVVI